MTRDEQRRVAEAFLQDCVSGRVDQAYEQYAAQEFVHHNPYFEAGAEPLKAGMKAAAAAFPGARLEVQRVLVDADLVAVHSRVDHGPGQPPIAVVHLMRFEGGRITELWDLGVVTPDPMPNQQGLF